jgi:hypothetical protein
VISVIADSVPLRPKQHTDRTRLRHAPQDRCVDAQRCERLTPYKQTNKQTPWLLVCKRTIPAERPPLVGES